MHCAQMRERFPSLRHSSYFNYGAAGPLSEDALAAMFNAYETLQACGPFSVEANLWTEQELAKTRAALEKELDAGAGSVALVESVCAACNLVLWGIDWQPGDHIVVSRSENAGVLSAVRVLVERFSLSLTECAVSRAAGCEDAAAAIERSLQPATRMVVLSHVLQATGETMPVSAVQERCRLKKVLLLVDGAQSAGAMPVSVRELGVDFYAFPGGKWWCGPSGLAGLYIRPDRIELLRPIFAGWRSFLPKNNLALARFADARRLEGGSMAVPLCAGLRKAIEIQEQAANPADRLRAIQESARYLIAGLRELSRHAPLNLIPADIVAHDSGIVAFSVTGTQPAELVYFLESRRILTREMADPGCVRVCQHCMTIRSEADLLLDGIGSFLDRKRLS